LYYPVSVRNGAIHFESEVLMKYCLVRLYGDGEITWENIYNEMAPVIGDECDKYTYLNHFEGGVVIAVVDDENAAGRAIRLINQLDDIAETELGESSFRHMLTSLLTAAVQGSEITAAQRAVVKQYFTQVNS
jgi:hypothetical protein